MFATSCYFIYETIIRVASGFIEPWAFRDRRLVLPEDEGRLSNDPFFVV
jgi:hypothetical protein